VKSWSPSLLVSIFVATILTACGSAVPRTLQTVSISPATADARTFPRGEVQFAATAYYNKSPMQVAPISASWGACDQNHPTPDITVSPAGVAQCSASAQGTYLIWAFAPDGANMSCTPTAACAGGCSRMTGTALLTCP
jgi:hypothetical protein